MAHSLCIGMTFVGAYSSYAQYPDGKVLLERLGVKIDQDGKPVADGSGGCLPQAYDTFVMQNSGKLTDLCGDETALKEDRWYNNTRFFRSSDECERKFVEKMGSVTPQGGRMIGDSVRSSEFLTEVFGEDFVSAFLLKASTLGEMLYTSLISEPFFAEYHFLSERYLRCRDRFGNDWKKQGMEKRFMAALLDSSRCFELYQPLEEKLRSQIEACGKLLEQYVSREDPRRRPLWESWDVFRNISRESDSKKVLTAERNFLIELEHVPHLKDYKHPVWISFSKVRTLLPEYLKSASVSLKADRNAKYYIEKKAQKFEERLENELGNNIKEYRKRFKGKDVYKDFDFQVQGPLPISTEPLTVKIRIKQEHYEDKDGTRKLYAEKWEKRVKDLDINLRLMIDARTKKLLSAFFEDEFIVDGQVVTNFGKNGLCIFENK